MRKAIGITVFVLLTAGGVISGVTVAHFSSLIHSADTIDRPVAVTATAVALSDGGRGGTYASVSYVTASGFERAQLPQLGHDAGDYHAPVRLVYDRSHPRRAMLAADWREGDSTGAHVALWVAVAVLAVVVAVFGYGLVRLIISLRRLS